RSSRCLVLEYCLHGFFAWLGSLTGLGQAQPLLYMAVARSAYVCEKNISSIVVVGLAPTMSNCPTMETVRPCSPLS
ncbi:MAG: hypothetical protein M3Z24_13585, partial [Chloroflexota bacterium]|nr:hypothetical protein [Chloroflexota bacterium]